MSQTHTSWRVGAHSWSNSGNKWLLRMSRRGLYRAILHSTITLSLAELAALAMRDELVS